MERARGGPRGGLQHTPGRPRPGTFSARCPLAPKCSWLVSCSPARGPGWRLARLPEALIPEARVPLPSGHLSHCAHLTRPHSLPAGSPASGPSATRKPGVRAAWLDVTHAVGLSQELPCPRRQLSTLPCPTYPPRHRAGAPALINNASVSSRPLLTGHLPRETLHRSLSLIQLLLSS